MGWARVGWAGVGWIKTGIKLVRVPVARRRRRRGSCVRRRAVPMPSTLSWLFDKDKVHKLSVSGTQQYIHPGDEVRNMHLELTRKVDSVERLLEQWHDMQDEIVDSVGLSSLRFHELWARMLLHYHESYPLPLRLVVIALLIPVDTSECERIFSLMNDIKTAERASMGSATLKNIMLWHRAARRIGEDGALSSVALSCAQLPAMEIVKIFKDMAGPKGRNRHRAALRPQYAYEAGFTTQARAE